MEPIQKLKEKIAQVDWEALNNAFGDSEEVPHLILMLVSPNKEDRDYGFKELANTIYHQGTIYEVSAYTIPFLLDIISYRLYDNTKEILWLLGWISVGHYRKPVSKKVDEELKNGKMLFQNILIGDIFLEKITALQILITIEDASMDLETYIKNKINKSNNEVELGHFLIALGYLKKDKIENVYFIEKFEASKNELIKIIIAAVLSNYSPELNYQPSITLLLNHFFNDPEKVRGIFEYWDCTEFYSISKCLLNYDYPILNKYSSEILELDKVSSQDPLQNLAYNSLEFSLLSMKASFEKEFDLDKLNPLQQKMINKILLFMKNYLNKNQADYDLFQLCQHLSHRYNHKYKFQEFKEILNNQMEGN